MSYVGEQPLVFFASVGVGACSCILYAVLWAIRRIAENKLIASICDIVFVTLSAGAYFLCLIKTSGGELRIYTVFAFLAGFAGFYLCLKPFAKKLAPLLDKSANSIKSKLKRYKSKPKTEKAKRPKTT